MAKVHHHVVHVNASPGPPVRVLNSVAHILRKRPGLPVLDARFDDRISRHREGQLGDDDEPELFPDNVDAFPERLGPDEDRVGPPRLELVEHDRRRAVPRVLGVALNEHLARQSCLEYVGEDVQFAVGRREDECASARRLHEVKCALNSRRHRLVVRPLRLFEVGRVGVLSLIGP